jgi:PleD family two-component response regulator
MNNIQQPRILVVDDNAAALKNIKMYLEDRYEVFLAESGSQALQICADRIPDLILIDSEMSRMDGFETLNRIKGNMILSRIPVIFLSPSHDMASKVQALESGAAGFITKPFERNILQHCIELHLTFVMYQQVLKGA